MTCPSCTHSRWRWARDRDVYICDHCMHEVSGPEAVRTIIKEQQDARRAR